MLVLKNTIKECRGEKHINQQQMADDLGVTRETLGKLERGQLQEDGQPLIPLVIAAAGGG